MISITAEDTLVRVAFESAAGELLIGHGRSAQQALDAAQFHTENMHDETVNVFGTCDVDLDIRRIAILLKELALGAGLSVVVVHQFLKADP